RAGDVVAVEHEIREGPMRRARVHHGGRGFGRGHLRDGRGLGGGGGGRPPPPGRGRRPRRGGGGRGGRGAPRRGGRRAARGGGTGSVRGAALAPWPGCNGCCQSRTSTPSFPVRASRTIPSSSETSTRAPGRPRPVFMSCAKTRIWSREVFTIASMLLPSTRVVAWSVLSSETFTTYTPGISSFFSSYVVSIGRYRAYPGTAMVHSASGATRPISSASTPESVCFLRK